MDWDKVLAVYRTLAEMTDRPAGLYVVAPDVVGNQAESMALLGVWRSALLELMERGCNVIVPVQAGPIPGTTLIDEIAAWLGRCDFIVGIPSNLAALAIEECATLRHDRFHILGRVQADAEQVQRVMALRRQNPAAKITADANWLRGNMRLVQQLTTSFGRLKHTGPACSFDHPRVTAVRAGIESDLAWGRPPIRGCCLDGTG